VHEERGRARPHRGGTEAGKEGLEKGSETRVGKRGEGEGRQEGAATGALSVAERGKTATRTITHQQSAPATREEQTLNVRKKNPSQSSKNSRQTRSCES
jgi:hypothetical protein